MTERPWLSPLLNEIADVAGVEAALAVAEARGGQLVSIPANAGSDHWLVRAVGRAAADAICHHFTGGRGSVERVIPLGPAGSEAKRRALLARLVAEGRTANEVAASLRVARRTVFRARARLRDQERPREGEEPEQTRQRDLFEP